MSLENVLRKLLGFIVGKKTCRYGVLGLGQNGSGRLGRYTDGDGAGNTVPCITSTPGRKTVLHLHQGERHCGLQHAGGLSM